jgi:hypothetical protein
MSAGGSRLMKNTTGDLWQGSRPTVNGIEPPEAERETQGGICHSMATSVIFKGVGTVKWLTGSRKARVTNEDID